MTPYTKLASLALAATLVLGNAAVGQESESMEMPMEAPALAFGELMLSGIYAFATLPNAPVGGGFLVIENNGADDRLVAAASDVAGEVQIHEMAMQGDVMRMRQLVDGLPIPAGETVELMPGGYHIMFMKLQQPLVEGEAFDVTLTFENAGEITVPVEVRSKRASH